MHNKILKSELNKSLFSGKKWLYVFFEFEGKNSRPETVNAVIASDIVLNIYTNMFSFNNQCQQCYPILDQRSNFTKASVIVFMNDENKMKRI